MRFLVHIAKLYLLSHRVELSNTSIRMQSTKLENRYIIEVVDLESFEQRFNLHFDIILMIDNSRISIYFSQNLEYTTHPRIGDLVENKGLVGFFHYSTYECDN